MLDIVSVPDKHICLFYENGNFQYVLQPGRYPFWKMGTERNTVMVDISKIEISDDIPKNLFGNAKLLPFLRSFTVPAHHKGILYVDGKHTQILDNGTYYFWVNPIPIQVVTADMRKLQLEIGGQDILTKDKAALRITIFTQYEIVDIVKAFEKNKDYDKQLYVNVQLALREFVGTLTLDEILDKKEAVSEFVLANVKKFAEDLGLKINNVGLRDIILPGDVKEIMNQVLIATKQAQANIIMRREETASTRSLLNTAKLMEENEMLFKLKEMEYIEKIATKINSISLSGGSVIVEQLKDLFTTKK